jgi:UDP:flavonoid glycosyltransferase YjiC (YdhE family)
VCGFFFRDPPSYTPPSELEEFLKDGPAPIYIGFGSIVMENPENMTRTILDAVHETGVRAIVSKGWSKLGTGVRDPNVFFLDDCPHGKSLFRIWKMLLLMVMKNGYSSM